MEQQLTRIPKDVYQAHLFPYLPMVALEALALDFIRIEPNIRQYVNGFYEQTITNAKNLTTEQKETLMSVLNGVYKFVGKSINPSHFSPVGSFNPLLFASTHENQALALAVYKAGLTQKFKAEDVEKMVDRCEDKKEVQLDKTRRSNVIKDLSHAFLAIYTHQSVSVFIEHYRNAVKNLHELSVRHVKQALGEYARACGNLLVLEALVNPTRFVCRTLYQNFAKRDDKNTEVDKKTETDAKALYRGFRDGEACSFFKPAKADKKLADVFNLAVSLLPKTEEPLKKEKAQKRRLFGLRK